MVYRCIQYTLLCSAVLAIDVVLMATSQIKDGQEGTHSFDALG